MTPDENRAIIEKLWPWAQDIKRLHLVAPYLTPDFKRHDVFRLFPDRAGTNGVNEHMSMLMTAMPDLRVDAIDTLAEGDRVCVRYVAYGTHTGELLGKPGTGNVVRWEGVNFYRLADGKLAETWQYMDALSVLRQLGVISLEQT